jgi:GDP-mannose transporter
MAFCAASLAMTLLNKAALSPPKTTATTATTPTTPPPMAFPVITLLAVQCLCTLLLTCLACALGYGRLPPALPWRRWAQLWLPVNALFAAMVATSFLALRHMGVPMLTVLKNLTSLLVILGDKAMFGKTYGGGVWATLALMTVSALCAAASDLEFSLKGYGWQLANNAATAAYSLALRLAIVRMTTGGKGVGAEEEEEEEEALLKEEEEEQHEEEEGRGAGERRQQQPPRASASSSNRPDDVGMVIYNNLGALPLLAMLAIGSGEPQRLMQAGSGAGALFSSAGGGSAPFAALASCAMGFLLSVASMWFMRCTTATTFSLVGSLNKVPLAVLGALMFAPAPGKAPAWSSPGHVASVAVGLCAGVVFARAKSREDEEVKKEEEERRRRQRRGGKLKQQQEDDQQRRAAAAAVGRRRVSGTGGSGGGGAAGSAGHAHEG